MPPSFLKHGLGRKPIRTSSQTSLDSASTIPNASGLTFIDNSQGASAAAVELSSVLDDAIEQLDLQGKADICISFQEEQGIPDVNRHESHQ